MKNTATLAIRDNVQRLMQDRGMSQRELAKLAGISQSAVGYLLRYKDVNDRHPTTSTIEAIAGVFGLQAWQLMIPDQPLAVLKSQQLEKHTLDYLQASEEARAAVDRITEVAVRPASSETLEENRRTKKAG